MFAVELFTRVRSGKDEEISSEKELIEVRRQNVTEKGWEKVMNIVIEQKNVIDPFENIFKDMETNITNEDKIYK